MKQYVKDLEGKYIEVTDLDKAIDECEMFVGFSEEGSHLHKHWSHILKELKKLEPIVEPVIVDVIEINGIFLSDAVIETRKKFGAVRNTKGFIKDDRTSPVYGVNSCARSYTILNDIDNLEIGESVYNSTPRKITRVW